MHWNHAAAADAAAAAAAAATTSTAAAAAPAAHFRCWSRRCRLDPEAVRLHVLDERLHACELVHCRRGHASAIQRLQVLCAESQDLGQHPSVKRHRSYFAASSPLPKVQLTGEQPIRAKRFAACSAFGQSFIFYTIANFDPLVCTTVTTTRKIFSVLLSIVLKVRPGGMKQRNASSRLEQGKFVGLPCTARLLLLVSAGPLAQQPGLDRRRDREQRDSWRARGQVHKEQESQVVVRNGGAEA
eukprot:scaffold8416_cov267-Pinguiococcus_pyrenoidosus.AAC.3